MTTPITHDQLQAELRSPEPPLLLDLRRKAAYLGATEVVPGALRRDPETLSGWAESLPRGARVVVFCAHGRDVSQRAAAELVRRGREARFLEGGLEGGWKAHGGALEPKAAGLSSRWVTRARPKIDRIACPWLIARFVDPEAEFLYVPPGEVLAVARSKGAVPYDVPDVAFSHAGERCSFDAFLDHYRLHDPALRELATIVRGADTGELDLAPQAPGLLAVSLGLSRLFADDHEMLRHGMVVYDALYAWCKDGQGETHTWNPEAYRVPVS
ncbi:MAG TPA: chromate resistance protein ChrB domain-containing protein [Planctomycetota bacterium]